MTFDLTDLEVKTSVLICFEDTFPRLARESVEGDTDFLVNLTNNGWFGESAAQWQHAASARFRAVENGLPLLRCSNNGLTCWVDAQGRLRQIFQDKTGSVYGAGFVTAKIPLRPPGERRAPTFYHEHGDWFGWGCVILSIVSSDSCPMKTWIGSWNPRLMVWRSIFVMRRGFSLAAPLEATEPPETILRRTFARSAAFRRVCGAAKVTRPSCWKRAEKFF